LIGAVEEYSESFEICFRIFSSSKNFRDFPRALDLKLVRYHDLLPLENFASLDLNFVNQLATFGSKYMKK
jgi:hypothetical protein